MQSITSAAPELEFVQAAEIAGPFPKEEDDRPGDRLHVAAAYPGAASSILRKREPVTAV